MNIIKIFLPDYRTHKEIRASEKLLSSRLTRAEKKVHDLQWDVVQLERTIEGQTATIKDQAETLGIRAARINYLEAETKRQQDVISKLDTQVAELESTGNVLDPDERKERLKGQIAHIADLEKTLAERNREITLLKRDIQDMASAPPAGEPASEPGLNRDMETRINELSAQLREAESKNGLLQAEVEHLKEHRDLMKAEVDEGLRRERSERLRRASRRQRLPSDEDYAAARGFEGTPEHQAMSHRVATLERMRDDRDRRISVLEAQLQAATNTMPPDKAKDVLSRADERNRTLQTDFDRVWADYCNAMVVLSGPEEAKRWMTPKQKIDLMAGTKDANRVRHENEGLRNTIHRQSEQARELRQEIEGLQFENAKLRGEDDGEDRARGGDREGPDLHP